MEFGLSHGRRQDTNASASVVRISDCSFVRGIACNVLLAGFLAIACNASADETSATPRGAARIDLTDLKRHLNTLASDSFEGREAGSRGGKAALAYLRSELKNLRESWQLPKETTQEFGREYHNLLLLLQGSDEQLKHEVVVVGAHYDHVGYGNASNSSGPIGQIHNGADDNASGASALLELIEAFASLETRPPRSILFVFWDAEELGLLGSKHWVAHPTVPLKDIRFALNIDMLGRLREGKLTTIGWRSAPGLRSLIASQNVDSTLRLAYQPRVNGDSDHYSFYANGIPVIHFDTDKHSDYHRPTDDPDKINWNGVIEITQFAYRIVLEATSRSDFPRFRRDVYKEAKPTWITPQAAIAPQVRLGVNWDQELAKQHIAQVAQINPDSPALQAGLRVGDRVLLFGTWEQGAYEDLKTTMQIATNPVSIRFKRAGVERPIETRVTLRGEAVRLGAGWVDDPAIPNCVAITHVVADSPADRAGIAAGDVIMRMGGRPIASAEQMRQRVIAEPAPYHFHVERQGCIREIDVTSPIRSSSNSDNVQVP